MSAWHPGQGASSRDGASISLNGKAHKPTMERGFAVLKRSWRAGDVVSLKLPMPVQRIEANPQVLADKGLVA
ncbi:MAG: hypothetical protein EOO77_22745, partial [Oxalobacteraceae bacterium]